MAAGGGNAVDFYFGNDFPKWIATAHTLKARYYMHTAENSDLSYDNTKLNSVLTETAQGIQAPSGDFATVHTSTTFEQNLFQQFLIGSRAGDVEPSSLHINLAKQFNDNALLAQLYNKNSAGQYLGSPPGVSAGSNVSTFALGRRLPAARRLVRGESCCWPRRRIIGSGIAGPALADLTLERTAYEGDQRGAPVVPSGTNGLLVGILEEKFVRLFLSPEVYFDYLQDLRAEHRASGEPHGRVPVRSCPPPVQLYGANDEHRKYSCRSDCQRRMAEACDGSGWPDMRRPERPSRSLAIAIRCLPGRS